MAANASTAKPPVEPAVTEILFLGAEGCGKSLLIRRLMEITKYYRSLQAIKGDELTLQELDLSSENTIPTIGVDLNTLYLTEVLNIHAREVGATMASRWDSYYDGCSTIVFVIDSSDLGSVSGTIALLHEVLSNCKDLQSKNFAIVFSKVDITDPVTLTYIDNLLRIQELSVRFPNLCIFRGSSLDGSLGLLLVDWFLALF